MTPREIIARLEAATGPDRDIDISIALSLFDAKRERGYYTWQSSRPQGSPEKSVEEFWRSRDRCPKFTASLDAAIALVEQVLPDSYRASGRTGLYPNMMPGSPSEKYWAECGKWGTPAKAYHDCEPVALLIALFRALSQEPKP